MSDKSTKEQIFFSHDAQGDYKKARLTDNITYNLKKDEVSFNQIRIDKSTSKIENPRMVLESETTALQRQSGTPMSGATPHFLTKPAVDFVAKGNLCARSASGNTAETVWNDSRRRRLEF